MVSGRKSPRMEGILSKNNPVRKRADDGRGTGSKSPRKVELQVEVERNIAYKTKAASKGRKVIITKVDNQQQVEVDMLIDMARKEGTLTQKEQEHRQAGTDLSRRKAAKEPVVTVGQEGTEQQNKEQRKVATQVEKLPAEHRHGQQAALIGRQAELELDKELELSGRQAAKELAVAAGQKETEQQDKEQRKVATQVEKLQAKHRHGQQVALIGGQAELEPVAAGQEGTEQQDKEQRKDATKVEKLQSKHRLGQQAAPIGGQAELELDKEHGNDRTEQQEQEQRKVAPMEE